MMGMIGTFFRRFIGVFSSPGELFREIGKGAVKRDLALPFLSFFLVTVISVALMEPVNRTFSKEMVQKSSRYTEEQKVVIIERIESSDHAVLKYVFGGLQSAVMFFIFTGMMFLLGNFIGGGEGSWIKILTGSIYIQQIDLLNYLVKVPLILYQKTIHVFTGAAMFFSEVDMSSPLFNAAAQLDFFRLWKYFLWFILFREMYKFSKNKSFIFTVIPFLAVMFLGIFLLGMSQ